MDNLSTRNATPARSAASAADWQSVAGGPKDLPDSGNNNPTPASPVGGPPPFGSNFDPHINPVTPPQNTFYEHHPAPEVIKSSTEDPVFHINLPPGYKPHHTKSIEEQPAPNPTPEKTNLPPIIEINHNIEPTFKKDPPAFGFFITNPVTYLKAFLKKLIKRQAITIKIPILAILVFMVGIGGFGLGFQSGINWALFKIFPNYSPILHRSITEQGTIQKSSTGYFLQSSGKSQTVWSLQPKSANVKLADFINQKVQVTGNLTSTPNLIEVLEVTSFDTKPSPEPAPKTTYTPQNLNEIQPNVTNPAPNGTGLPKLYPLLSWEITQTKTLTFTSGKRRIEQEGVYLESSVVGDYPQDFMSYYTSELTNLGFKQTLNSFEPNGTTITYSKNDLFLTFGIKNIYKGSGENKQLVGYKAFLEHN